MPTPADLNSFNNNLGLNVLFTKEKLINNLTYKYYDPD